MQQKPKTGSHRGYGASCFFCFQQQRVGQANKKRVFFFARHSACTLAEAQVRRRLGRANKKRVFSLLATRLALWLKPKLGGASDEQIKNEFFLCSPLGLHFGCAQVRRRLGRANKKRGFFFARHSACTNFANALKQSREATHKRQLHSAEFATKDYLNENYSYR